MRFSLVASACLLIHSITPVLFATPTQAAPRDVSDQRPTSQPAEKKATTTPPTTSPAASALEPKYPFRVKSIALLDLATGSAQPAELTAGDRSSIEIIQKQKEPVRISTDSTVEWSIGNFSETKFSGSSAISGGLGVVAGALIVPSPATPLLLLMAPFIGMASANVYKPEWRIGIREIGPDGREQLILVQAFNEKDTAAIRAVLEYSTGLKAGQRRSDSELATVREQRLVALETRLATAREKLMVINPKKAWCSTLDLTGSAGSTKEYDSLIILINDLRKALGKEPYIENAMASSEVKWEAYLVSRPDISSWAKANPVAAKGLQSCSNSTSAN